MFAQPQFDQNATGDESEAEPPSSQQRFKPGGSTRHAALRRNYTNPGNSASNADRDRRAEGKDEDETVGEHEELMTRVPQQTERPMATVQLTVIKSEAD